jgi:hypothetical protein
MATGEEIQKFWVQTRAELSKVDMDARVELVESSDPFVMEGGHQDANSLPRHHVEL